jgi:hypothetical protein
MITAELRQAVETIAAAEAPLVFHCASGKDRCTGMRPSGWSSTTAWSPPCVPGFLCLRESILKRS